jgi:hypothetical protein
MEFESMQSFGKEPQPDQNPSFLLATTIKVHAATAPRPAQNQECQTGVRPLTSIAFLTQRILKTEQTREASRIAFIRFLSCNHRL